MKIISWNVNGIRAALKKGFGDFLAKESPDIICLQETKALKDQVGIDFENYHEFWNSAERKGYSGTAIFSKEKPLNVIQGIVINNKIIDDLADKYGDGNKEGRVITLEFEKFFITTCYTPNSKPDLTRLEYRHKKWDPIFLQFVKELEKKKPVIFTGDLNVAHNEIDLAKPDTNHFAHGFTDEEREGFSNIVTAGFVDTYRHLYPDQVGAYTWWSPFQRAREKNVGWRIDYVCISNSIATKLKKAFIMPEVMGSDHCPIGIEIDL